MLDFETEHRERVGELQAARKATNVKKVADQKAARDIARGTAESPPPMMVDETFEEVED